LSQGAPDAGTSTSEVLDAYEEGTWTPTCTFGTLSTAVGNYRKIGGHVWVGFLVSGFSDRSTSGAIKITNLPFTPITGNGYASGGAVFGRYTNAIPFATYVATTGINFYVSSSGNYSTVNHSHLTSASSQFYAEATYFV